MIADVREYARSRLDVLGYDEWSDGFDFKDIPLTKLDESYHLELGSVRGVSNNQTSLVMECPFTVRLFISPSGDPKSLIDQGIDVADTVIADLMKSSNRTLYSGLQNIGFVGMTIEPLDQNNDNGVIIRIEFNAMVTISTI